MKISEVIDNTNQHIEQLKIKLKDFSPISTSLVFSGMLLDPKYQSCTYRLEYAINLCLSFCRGSNKPNQEIIFDINQVLENSGITHMEDPVEDINISTLWLNNKRYKVMLGLWEGCIPQTQLFLNILEELPVDASSNQLKIDIETLLNISNMIIEKNSLDVSNDDEIPLMDRLLDCDIESFEEYQDKATLTIDEVSVENIDSMVYNGFHKLDEQEFGNTKLELTPINIEKDNVYLLLPTAITITIRRHIIKHLKNLFSETEFVSLLKTYLTNDIKNINIFRKFEQAPVEFVKKTSTGKFEVSDVLIEFDKGYYYHFVFVIDTLFDIEKDWFAGFSYASEEEVEYIDKLIQNTRDRLIREDENIKGCSFIVPCGFGRGVGLGSNFETSSSWVLESITLHDLETLSNDFSCSPHLIWRIVESTSKLKSMGIHVMNVNGFLNLYGYVKDNNHSLILNDDSDDNQMYSMIMLPTDCQLGLRKKVQRDIDLREVVHPYEGRVLVRRAFSDAIFNTNPRYNIYMKSSKENNIFSTVYIDSEYSIWLEQPIQKEVEFALQFQVYESFVSWFCKIIITLKKYQIPIDKSFKIWKSSFEFPINISDLKKDIVKEEIYQSSDNKFSNGVLNTSFSLSLMKGFLFEQNYSEQTIILSFLQFVYQKEQKIEIGALLHEIIRSEDARHTHFLMAKSYRDYFGLDREEPIYIERIDESNIKLNLGWSNRSRDESNIIEGKAECKKYLNGLVEVVWDILRTKLFTLEREYLVDKLLTNIELCDHQSQRWKRTFKANLSLQEDDDDTYKITTRKLGQLNAATLASRLVIEMAICECSVNCGKEAGKLDIQEVICLASMLHHLGGLSEAISFEATTSRIQISNFGDILFDQTFNDLVVGGYGLSIQKKELQSSVDSYGENFLPETTGEKAIDVFETKFQNAFIAEFGYEIDDAREFIDAIEDLGFKKNKLVFSMDYDELIESFDEKNKLIFTKVLNSFIIYSRRKWTDIPKPYKPTDWQPWKFRRRYSVAMKPIIQVNSFENSLLISPQLLRNMFVNLMRNCHEAFLDENHFQSDQMQHWIGSTRHENGIEFERSVADRLKELGFEVMQGIKLPQILNKKMDDYGDIDVLAWDKANNIVYPIECKGLEFAKTHGEIAKQLYEFKGQINAKGKKDRLLKHIRRIEELEKDVQGLAKFTRLNNALTIKGLIVFSNIVPMIFDDTRQYKEAVDFLSYDNLNSLLSKS